MSFLLFPLLNAINKKYQKRQYQRILRGFSSLYSNKDKYSSYANLHRVFSLLLTDDSRWRSEFEYMQKEGQIELLGAEDVKYISLYLIYIADGKLQIENQMTSFDISKVSKRTKKFFPMDMAWPKTFLEDNKAS